MVANKNYLTTNPGIGMSRDTAARRAQDLRQFHKKSGVYWIQPSGYSAIQVYCDMEYDQGGWMCAFTCFPRDTSCYNTAAVGGLPTPFDTTMNKFDDGIIKAMLNDGDKITRTQWYHRSVEFTSIWADGELGPGATRGTQWNEFDTPNDWFSNSSSSGATFRRSRGNPYYGGQGWSGTYTSQGRGCSGAVGGWSNYYQQSCVQSWYAGCEGGPACNHRCAGGVQDRTEKMVIWVR